jgi:uncharacterized protein (TIGR04255 family)
MYKREQLRKAPLIEAIFEVRATCRTNSGLIPGGLFGLLKDRFPIQEGGTGLVVGPADSAQLAAMHRFLSADRKRLVQCGPDLFTVNVLGDYGAFPEFAELIKSSLEAFYSVAVPTKLKRIGIRYINFLPSEAVAAAGNSPLRITAAFPQDVLPKSDSIALRGTFPHPKENGVLGLAIANPHQLGDGRTGCILDFDFFVENPPFLAVEDSLPWAARAHDVIYQAFRSSMTPEMYKQLEPVARGSN